MVIYKKFHVYFVDPQSLENVADMGECFISIAEQTTPIQSASGSKQLGVQLCETAFNGVFSGENIRVPIFDYPTYLDVTYSDSEFPGLSFSVWDDLTKFITVTRLPEYDGGSTSVFVKLLADNGLYALSLVRVNPSDPFAGITGLFYGLYDNNGTFITNTDLPLCFGYYASGADPSLQWYGVTLDSAGNIATGRYYNNNYLVGTSSSLVRTINSQTGNMSSGMAQWFNGIPNTDPDEPEEPEDPYSPGGDTGDDDTPGEGGDGNYNDDDTPVPIPDVPDETTEATATNSKFITLFAPSSTELNNLANYMWSNSFDIDTFKKLFANPMDCILGLAIVPFVPTSTGSGAVTVGNISTGVNMNKCKQYKEIDCGSINVSKYWGAYLDYSPFTKAEIYLPFIGMRPLQIDDIMGKTVKVVYHVDVLSGACIAYVRCGGSVLYNFVGQCSQSIPVASNDFTNVVNGALSIAGSIGSMVASGGASAPYAAGSIVSSALNALKPNIERSGALSGGASMMEIKKPYLVITRPKQAVAKSQNSYMGLPTWIKRNLSSVSGFTKVETVIFKSSHATQSEAEEIEQLLKEGVFL